MSKLGDFLKKLADDAGIAADNADLLTVINNPAIADVVVPPVVANLIFEKLLTEASAAANPKIKSLLTAQALNPIDTTIDTLAEKHGVKDKWIEFRETNVKKNGDGKFNTYESFQKFNDFLAEEVKVKATGNVSADKAKLVKDIEDLNNQALSLKTTYEKQIAEINNARSTDKINWSMDNLFTGFNYAMEETMKMPKDACVTTAKTFAFQKLNEAGYKIVQDETGNITLKTKEDSDVFEQNKKIGVSDYFSKVLTDNNFLKVSAVPPPKEGKGFEVDTSKFGHGQNNALSKLDAALNDAANDLK